MRKFVDEKIQYYSVVKRFRPISCPELRWFRSRRGLIASVFHAHDMFNVRLSLHSSTMLESSKNSVSAVVSVGRTYIHTYINFINVSKVFS